MSETDETKKPPPSTHVMLRIEDANKMLQLLGEVPAKYGAAWAMDVLRKSPIGTVNATAPPDEPADIVVPPAPQSSPK